MKALLVVEAYHARDGVGVGGGTRIRAGAVAGDRRTRALGHPLALPPAPPSHPPAPPASSSSKNPGTHCGAAKSLAKAASSSRWRHPRSSSSCTRAARRASLSSGVDPARTRAPWLLPMWCRAATQ